MLMLYPNHCSPKRSFILFTHHVTRVHSDMFFPFNHLFSSFNSQIVDCLSFSVQKNTDPNHFGFDQICRILILSWSVIQNVPLFGVSYMHLVSIFVRTMCPCYCCWIRSSGYILLASARLTLTYEILDFTNFTFYVKFVICWVDSSL